MTKDTEVDFNVFVGAETGILKGINVHSKGNIVKNFHNLKSLDKQFEITCASFGDGEGEILMGLRNQSVKVTGSLPSPSFFFIADQQCNIAGVRCCFPVFQPKY